MTTTRGHFFKAPKAAKALGWVTLTGAMIAVPLGLTSGTANASDWDQVAQCESSGNWGADTGNGFYGGLQFTQSTWAANGGTGSPQGASKAEQERVADNVLASQGAGAWPVCGQYISHSSSYQDASSNDDSGTDQSTDQSTDQGTDQSTDQGTDLGTTVQNLTVPQSVDEASSEANQVAQAANKAGADYVVQAGDTLSKIAQEHGISGGWQDLFQKNADVLSNPNMIFAGQGLSVNS